MKINYRCTGGYANLNLSYQVDTQDVSAALAQELTTLVQQARVFELDSAALASPGGGPPDLLTYHLDVQDGGRRRSLTCTDITAPDSLRPLLDRLQELATSDR